MTKTVFVIGAFRFALLSGLGRTDSLFQLWSHTFAVIPGLPRDYARAAVCYLTKRFYLISRMFNRFALGVSAVPPIGTAGVTIGAGFVVTSEIPTYLVDSWWPTRVSRNCS